MRMLTIGTHGPTRISTTEMSYCTYILVVEHPFQTPVNIEKSHFRSHHHPGPPDVQLLPMVSATPKPCVEYGRYMMRSTFVGAAMGAHSGTLPTSGHRHITRATL